MASGRRRWRYRDPSWLQICLLYLLAITFAFDPTPTRMAYVLVFAFFVTVLVVVKVMRKPGHQTKADDQFRS